MTETTFERPFQPWSGRGDASEETSLLSKIYERPRNVCCLNKILWKLATVSDIDDADRLAEYIVSHGFTS